MPRPLRNDEISYLERTQEALLAARQTLYFKRALWALPVAFFAFTLLGHGRDAWSAALAALIILGFMGAILSYGRSTAPTLRYGRAEAAMLAGLDLDLLTQETHEETITVTSKERSKLQAKKNDLPGVFLLCSEGRKWRVGAAHWLSIGVGDTLDLAFAERSEIVLTINGRDNRLTLPVQRNPDQSAPEHEGQ